MNVVAVSTKYATLSYLFQNSFPTTLSITSYIEYLSGWVDVIKGKGCRMMVVTTFLTACIQFIGSDKCSFLSIVFFFLPIVVFLSGQVV